MTSDFIILCSIRQGARHIVSEIANQGYDLQGGVFLLPHVNIIYTPQCFAEVVFARKQVEHELEEHAIEAMEVVFAQPLGVLACLYALISTTKVNFLLLVHKHTTFPMSKSSVLQTNAYTVFLHAHVGATEQGESDNCVEIGDSDSSPQKVNHRWHPLC